MLKTLWIKCLLFGHIYGIYVSYEIISHMMLGELQLIFIHWKVNCFILETKCAHHLMGARLCLLLQIHTRQVYYLKD